MRGQCARPVRTLCLFTRSALAALILLGLFLLPPTHCPAFGVGAPLAIDDVLAETSIDHELVPLSVSRDGKLLAYTETREGTVSTLCVLNLQTRSRTNISEGLPSVAYPIWSPDGQFLAFLVADSNQPAVIHQYEVWVWSPTSSTRRRLTAAVARPLYPGHLLWTADSRFLITDVLANDASAKPPNESDKLLTKQPAGVTVREQAVNVPKALLHSSSVATSSSSTQQGELAFDVGRVDLRSGALKRIAKGVLPRTYAVAPIGSAVALLSQDKQNPDDLDLWLTDRDSSQLHKAISHVALGNAALSWAPNGRLLALHSTNLAWKEQLKPGAGLCDVIELPSLKQTKFPVETYDPRNMNVPLWTDESDAVMLVEFGKIVRHSIASGLATGTIAVPGGVVESLIRNQVSTRLSDTMIGGRLVAIVIDSNGTSMRVVTIDPNTKAVSTLGDEGSLYLADAAALVPQSKSVVLGVEGPGEPFDLFLFGVATRQRQRLTHLNPQYDRYVFGQARNLPYRNATGENRSAILLLPSDYRPGTRYPTIVFERDRASAHFARHFGLWGGSYNMQIYATRGYAILYPDIEITRAPHERVTSDVLPAIDAAIETGVVDPDRLALYGHSLGGYHAMMLLVQTTRFKAAIVSEGYYNLFALYTQEMNYTEGYVTGTLGPPWQYPGRYVDNSPYMSIDKLTTPILLVGGSRDPYVEQGDQLFAALRRASKTAQYIRYEGEAHNASYWSLSNRRDYIGRTLAWLDFWLRPKT